MATDIPHRTIEGAGRPGRPGGIPGPAGLIIGGIMAGALPGAPIRVPVRMAAGTR